MSTWEKKKKNTKRSGLRTSKLQRHIFLYLTQEKIAVVLTPTLHRQHKYLMECENFYPCTRCAASLISVVIIAFFFLFFFFLHSTKKSSGARERERSRASRGEILDDEIDTRIDIVKIKVIHNQVKICGHVSLLISSFLPPEKFIFNLKRNYDELINPV